MRIRSLENAIAWLKTLARAIISGVCGLGGACLSHQRGASGTVALIVGAAVTGVAVGVLSWATNIPAQNPRSDGEAGPTATPPPIVPRDDHGTVLPTATTEQTADSTQSQDEVRFKIDDGWGQGL